MNRTAVARELVKIAKGLMGYGDYYIVVTLDHGLLMGDADEILSDVKRHAKDAKISDVDDHDDRADVEIGSDDEKGLEAAARHLAQTDKVSKVLSRK
jgi:hypothetical protein